MIFITHSSFIQGIMDRATDYYNDITSRTLYEQLERRFQSIASYPFVFHQVNYTSIDSNKQCKPSRSFPTRTEVRAFKISKNSQ